MNQPSEDALRRLAVMVERRRRDELGLRQDQLPHGPSTTTMTQIESGEPVSKLSYKRLEKSLGWEAGSVDAILAGGNPSVSGTIRNRAGKMIRSFRSVGGSEQELLERLRLATVVLDARDLAHSQKGPLMTALGAVLDEAADLVVRVIARDDDEDDLQYARAWIDEMRATTTIRRQGNVYVLDDGVVTVPGQSPEARETFDEGLREAAHRAARDPDQLRIAAREEDDPKEDQI